VEIKEVYENMEIKNLHKYIFFEDFPEEELRNKEKSKIVKKYLIYNEEKIIGYTIIFDNNELYRYHIWLGGILPEFQKNGYYSKVLDIFKVKAQEIDYDEITVSTYNHRPHMLRLLIKKGYFITGTTDGKYGNQTKILLKYIIIKEFELRIALTNTCNFNCIFCHGEGTFSQNKVFLDKKTLENILFQSYLNGCKKITLTGGEPLLNMDGIITTIEYCNKMKEYPILTIVTNGSLIDKNFIEILKKYKGIISLNISLHTFDEKEFDKITLTSNKLISVVNAIDLLNKNKISYRINCVFIKDLTFNNEFDKIKKFITNCQKKEISEVTFIEILIPKINNEMLKYYFSFENISDYLNEVYKNEYNFKMLKKTSKKESYFLELENNSIKINIFRLSCKIGCKQCINLKDRMIGPDGNYYPCLFYPTLNFKNVSLDMKQSFKDGELVIRQNIYKLIEFY
jgi:molybdenum cofactor biosynthesis enzyme MoaA